MFAVHSNIKHINTINNNFNHIESLNINYDGTVLIYGSHDYNYPELKGISKVYEYSTDWYQIGNDISGISDGGWGGWTNILDKSGKQIAITDIRQNNGTVRILKYNPIGTSLYSFYGSGSIGSSLYNFYGSGIDSASTILVNNERLYMRNKIGRAHV